MKKGDHLGEFRLLQRIGVGAQGRVWRAVHEGSGVQAAVKVVERHFAGRTHTWAAELNALARLDHPNIARVHDYGLVEEPTDAHLDGVAWLAMEFCTWPFETLASELSDWESTHAVLATIARGLAHAHARGVVHRDLKPGNLLVGTPAGAEDTPPSELRPRVEGLKIVDFGIAILDGATLRRARGTPAYMAPEQFVPEPSRLGPWTDLYSLGTLAWLLVTGLRPFPRLEPAALLEAKRILALEPFLPRFDVPDGLEDCLRRSMHPDIGSRYLCVPDLLADLDALGTATIPGTAGPAPDQSVLPTVPAQPLSDPGSRIPPLPAVKPARRPRQWSPEVLRPWPDGAPLAALRDIPLVGRERERDILWAELRPGRRIHLHGEGALDLARWSIRRLREQSGRLASAVEGHADDSPGEALERVLDDLLGFSGSSEPVRAAREALVRYRAHFGAADYALRTLLGLRAQTSVVRHGAAAAILRALCRQRGLVVLVATAAVDRDLCALVSRLDRELPDATLVLAGAWSERLPERGDRWFQLEVGPPALDEAVDALCALLPVDRPTAAERLRAHGLDVARAVRTPVDPLRALDGLLPSEVTATEYAAVLGTVSREVWADVVTLTPGALIGLEDELVRRGVARRRPGGWVFRDRELQDALRQRLEDNDRLLSAAAAVADALDGRGADPLRRGRLWLLAGKAERAVRTWIAGADRIEDAHGRRASVDLWGFARVVATELPPSEAVHGEIDTRHVAGMVMLLDRRREAGELAGVHRLAFESRGWNRAAALCCWVQAVAAGVADAPSALQAIDDGLELARSCGARDIMGRLWGMRFRLSHEHATGEHLDDLRNARDALEGVSDARSRLLYRRMAGLHAQMTGDLDAAIGHFAAQVEIARNERPTALPESIVQHAVALSMADQAPDAERLLDEALDLATFAESVHQAAYASINLMSLALKRSDYGKAASMASRSLEFARHSPHASLACHLGLAVCAFGLGDPSAQSAWALARKALLAEHVPEPDFADMLDQLATLTSGPIAAEAAELAARERARLPAPEAG